MVSFFDFFPPSVESAMECITAFVREEERTVLAALEEEQERVKRGVKRPRPSLLRRKADGISSAVPLFPQSWKWDGVFSSRFFLSLDLWKIQDLNSYSVIDLPSKEIQRFYGAREGNFCKLLEPWLCIKHLVSKLHTGKGENGYLFCKSISIVYKDLVVIQIPLQFKGRSNKIRKESQYLFTFKDQRKLYS